MKRTFWLLLLGLTFSYFCLFHLQPSRANVAQERARLFELVGDERALSSVTVAGAREQEIGLDLRSVNVEAARELELPLLDGQTHAALRDGTEGFVRFAADEYTWRGKIFGEGGWRGDVILSAKGRAMSGLIYAPSGVYEIVPQSDFRHLLVQVDQSEFPACAGTRPPRPESENIEERAPSSPDSPVAADDGSNLDVLVVYTAPVRTSLGGTEQAQAFAQQAVASANTAYLNSNITTRLRLASATEVAYTETGTLGAALDWVVSDPGVAATRNSVKADLVAILVEQASDGCGLGYLMTNVGPGFANSAFSATARTCAVGNLTFAHELGHNQGCHHNPENGGPPTSTAYPYAFGHYVDGAFRTVMSYSNPCTQGCSRVAHFSNPSVSFNGVPTGVADQRDNSRVINNTALVVSQFRDSGGVPPCTYSLSPTSLSFTATGGSGSFAVTTGGGCAWTASSGASWLTVTSGAGGTGGATVGYSVAVNTSLSQRTATVTVGGQTHTVTQAGAPVNVRVTVGTNPAGRAFTVDGITYSAAQTFTWARGTAHTVSTTSPQGGTTGTRYVWGSWSDGGAISHTVAPLADATYTANFTTQHSLTTTAGAGGSVSPASGWLNRGRTVTITATPNAGYGFNGWTGTGTGSFTGQSNPATVTMNGPLTQTASFSASGLTTNLALGRTARQSSTLSVGAASRAVDGNLDGEWARNSLASTLSDAQAWWEVDLGGVQSLGQVKLWNRTDCCSERLSNFYVLVSDTPFASTGLSATLTQPGVSAFHVAGQAGRETTVAVNRAGRYVRIQLAGANYLTLAEVQVWGSQPVNLARGKPAAQSSTTSGGVASRATDGNTSGGFAQGSVTATLSQAQAWWEVDLLGVRPVGQVKLWNRTDCCSERLANFYVLVSDAPFASTSLAAARSQAGVTSFYVSGAAGVSRVVGVNRTARYVRVQLAGTNNLSLAEVEVWSGPSINLAAGKAGAQSSTNSGGAAGRATDANTDGNWLNNSVTLTLFESQPRWEVDLGSVRRADSIRVWNRADCCSDRLADFHVLVSDTPFTSSSLSATLLQPGVASFRTTGQAGRPTTINVNRTGRYVRVQLAGTNYLSLAEVEVLGNF
ncbi:MAG TPA: discoidin domain-containing protein [Pyrinomonadaceae bacterium]|nr:discoidin domain-containing protein [Pyrinomonadaceae bacterium]